MALVTAIAFQLAAFSRAPASEPLSVNELLKELHARPPWYYRWIDRNAGLRRSLPRVFISRIHRADFEISMRRSKAARQLGDLGTNTWVATPVLIEGLTRNIYDGVLAASVLAQIGADNAPQWKSLQQHLSGRSVPVQVFSWFLHGKNEFGQPYDLTHKRFALSGLGRLDTQGSEQFHTS
jgi:hypothetical protein